MIRRAGVALLLSLAALPAAAEDTEPAPPAEAPPPRAPTQRPLFELGLAGGGGYTADYPAAAQSHWRGLVTPWLIYRGDILRADEQGARARTWLGDRIELAVSGSGSFPASSSDNDARRGMPDLDWIGEIGPTIIWTVWRDLDPASPRRIVLDTPIRAAFSTNLSSIAFRGFTFEPDIAWQQRNLLVDGSRLRVSIGAIFGTTHYLDYFYTVPAQFATPERPAYSARGGYLGSRLSLSFRVPVWQSLSLVLGGRIANFSGAANADSPLYLRQWNYAVAAGFSWTIFQSGRQVDSSIEPFD